MRRLILKMSISIDGFVGGPNGEVDWIFRGSDSESKAWTLDTVSQAGAHLIGSRTFKKWAGYWPTSTDPFAAPMNQIPKVVFSRSQSTTRALLDEQANAASPPAAESAVESWKNARVATGDLAEEIAALKREPGKDLLAQGGASFVQSLVKLGLIDEYRLLVHPVALGRGLPLFSSLTAPLDLELIEAKRFSGGVIAHVYRKKG